MRQILFLAISSIVFAATAGAKLISLDGQTQAIYGADDRQFVGTGTDKQLKKLSEAVALIVNNDSVENKFFTSLIKANYISDANGVNLCGDAKFANHHSLNSCTGFLIAPDLVASAGHCFMSADDCANKKIVFQVRSSNEVTEGYKVLKNAVYECQEIVKSSFNADNLTDFAVIRLKKKVTDRTPLKLRQKGTANLGDAVFMIGHPLGLPQVLSSKAFINDVENQHYFKANLDSFEGNSGSPVFNAKTYEVEGVLVRGEDDFVEDSSKQCYRYQTYDEGVSGQTSLKGEGVSRISELLPL